MNKDGNREQAEVSFGQQVFIVLWPTGVGQRTIKRLILVMATSLMLAAGEVREWRQVKNKCSRNKGAENRWIVLERGEGTFLRRCDTHTLFSPSQRLKVTDWTHQ